MPVLFTAKKRLQVTVAMPMLAGLVTLGLGSSSIALAGDQTSARPVPVAQVDLDKYLGQWYEIAHLPMFFQRKCASHTTAQYSLDADKHIVVLNQCKTKQGEWISSTGIATATNKNNNQLKVSFLPRSLQWLPFTKGDYWILKLDQNYQTALVGGPSHKYLWILSRTPQIDEATYQEYIKAAQAQGYDTNKLIRNPH